jgi:hypothetical protein
MKKLIFVVVLIGVISTARAGMLGTIAFFQQQNLNAKAQTMEQRITALEARVQKLEAIK